MIDELEGRYHKTVYQTWKNGKKTAQDAGKIVCEKYEKPKDTIVQPKERGKNASKIYNRKREKRERKKHDRGIVNI